MPWERIAARCRSGLLRSRVQGLGGGLRVWRLRVWGLGVQGFRVLGFRGFRV